MHEGFVLRGGRGCYLAAVGVSIYPPRTLFVKPSQAGAVTVLCVHLLGHFA